MGEIRWDGARTIDVKHQLRNGAKTAIMAA